MLFLIAESKTMEDNERSFSNKEYLAHRPICAQEAEEINDRIRQMSIEEIAAEIKVSLSMASKIYKMAYNFPFKNTGNFTIDSFTGVVFTNLQFDGFSSEEKERADQNLRIVSSLYGWLRPKDIIKPYRLEFSSPLSPDGKPLYSFWRKFVTIQLVKYLQETGTRDIIHLLPGDAAKCIDWKLVKRFAKVWKVEFKEQSGETLKTPSAGKLKAMRGQLLQEALKRNIKTPKELIALETDTFLPLGTPQYPDHITYII